MKHARLWFRFVSVLSLTLATSPLLAQQASTPAAGSRPNILLIIGDDFGMDVTSTIYPGLIDDLVEHYGPTGLNHPQYQEIAGRPASTPVLARLAQQGIEFTHAWAHPFCSPTRAAIITGLFADKTRVVNYQNPLSKNHTTFVRRLHDEGGYSTAIFGKWHLAGLPGTPENYPGIKPKQAGFDLFRGNLHAAIATYWDYDYQVQDDSTGDNEWREEKPPTRSLPGVAGTTYAPVVKIADTIEWIRSREAADADKPWFAWLAYNLSHATAQRQPSQMAVPNADTLGKEAYEEMKACGGQFGTQETGTCSGESLMRAMTNSMDTLLGKLIEAVDAADPNTYIIFIGDNGTPMYGRPNLDFIDNMYITRSGRGKGTVYESGARVPLVIRGPRIAAGSSNDSYVHAVDLYATVLDLAGLAVPKQVSNAEGTGQVGLDSRSLAPIAFGHAQTLRDPDRDYILTETEDLMRNAIREVGARNGRYKVLCTNDTQPGDCRFFDVANDPLEEYPLTIPDSCAGYANGSWTPDNEAWHYCRLTEVVAEESFL